MITLRQSITLLLAATLLGWLPLEGIGQEKGKSLRETSLIKKFSGLSACILNPDNTVTCISERGRGTWMTRPGGDSIEKVVLAPGESFELIDGRHVFNTFQFRGVDKGLIKMAATYTFQWHGKDTVRYEELLITPFDVSKEMTAAEIYTSTILTLDQKILQLEKALARDPFLAPSYLLSCDASRTRPIVARFRHPDNSVDEKIHLGKFLLREGKERSIIPEFKEFLLTEIEKQFETWMNHRGEPQETAFDEYVYLLDGRSTHDETVAEAFRDDRILPYLLRAFRHVPPSGKNSAPQLVEKHGNRFEQHSGFMSRIFIPRALARMRARSVLPDLERRCTDPDMADGCAFALGFLLEGDQKRSFEKSFIVPKKVSLFEYIQGSIAAQDYTVLALLDLGPCNDASLGETFHSGWLYDQRLRVDLLAKIHHPDTRSYYGKLISDPYFRRLMAAGPDMYVVSEAEWKSLENHYKNKEAYVDRWMLEVAKMYRRLFEQVGKNGFVDLHEELTVIGQSSANPEIRTTARSGGSSD